MSNGLMRREYKRKNIQIDKNKTRPKTFKSEEAANTYAKNNNIKDYVLENIKLDPNTTPKIRIVKK